MSRSRVTFSSHKASQSSKSNRRNQLTQRHNDQDHGFTLHGGEAGTHVKPIYETNDDDYYEERIWDVRRTKQEFVKQNLFMPNYTETMSLLSDLHDNLCHEPGYVNHIHHIHTSTQLSKVS